MYVELIVRTQYDGRDYVSVEDIYYLDEAGDEFVCKEATDACIDLVTCGDQGTDLWEWLRTSVERRLKDADIKYEYLSFEDEC